MIGLDTATGEDDVGPLGDGAREQELQLSQLVSGLGAAGDVVSFDPELDAEALVERAQAQERSRQMREMDPRDHLTRSLRGARPLRSRRPP